MVRYSLNFFLNLLIFFKVFGLGLVELAGIWFSCFEFGRVEAGGGF